MEESPKKKNFEVSVTYNEILERWVAIDNRTQEIIGYGLTSMEAFMSYLDQSVEKQEAEDDTNLF